MKYQIMISYETGNSFGTEDREELLELDWDDLIVAKQNLNRIKEHYEYYKSSSYSSHKDRVCPHWMADTESSEYSIELLADNGQIWKIGVYWMGYFEQLYEAEIIINNSDMKITIN